MAVLTRDEVLEIAMLARLHLEPDEIERLRGELSTILESMDRLKELDTEGVEPMTHAVPMRLRLRDDRAEPSLSADEAVAQAPDRADHLFQVPSIIKSKA